MNHRSVTRPVLVLCALTAAGCLGRASSEASSASPFVRPPLFPTPTETATVTATPAASPTSTPPWAEVGLNVGQPIDDAGGVHDDSANVAASGAGWVRLNIRLGSYASVNDSQWRAQYDTLVDGYLARGVRIYALVGAEAVKSSSALGSDGWMDDYVAAFVATVDHFRDRVRVFESYNEPNNWNANQQPTLPADRFAIALARIYAAVKVDGGHVTDPSWQVTLVSGPLFSFTLDTAAAYLDQTFQYGRAHAGWDSICAQTGSFPFDAVGYHLYVREDAGATADDVAAAIRTNERAVLAVLDAQEANCPASVTPKPLWLSEVGWNASYSSEQTQARNVDVMFQALRADPRVAGILFFELQDSASVGAYGLFRVDGSKRPSWQAFHAGALATPTP